MAGGAIVTGIYFDDGMPRHFESVMKRMENVLSETDVAFNPFSQHLKSAMDLNRKSPKELGHVHTYQHNA